MPAASASAIRPRRRQRSGVVADGPLDHGQDVRARRGTARRLDLEAVVRPGVVRGGDHHAARRAPLDHLVRGHLGRDRATRHGDRDVVRQQHLGRGLGEVLAREAPVVADDHALGRWCPGRGPTGPRPGRSGARSRRCSPRRSGPASRRCRRRWRKGSSAARSPCRMAPGRMATSRHARRSARGPARGWPSASRQDLARADVRPRPSSSSAAAGPAPRCCA